MARGLHTTGKCVSFISISYLVDLLFFCAVSQSLRKRLNGFANMACCRPLEYATNEHLLRMHAAVVHFANIGD